jgi:hypothetical protein
MENSAMLSQRDIDIIARARDLIADARSQTKRVAGLADLGRAAALKKAAGDRSFTMAILAMEGVLERLSKIENDCRAIRQAYRDHDDTKKLAAALAVQAARARGVELDSEAAAIKRDSARFAGLWRQAQDSGSAPEKQRERDEARLSLDSRRAKLAADRRANKFALDDADLSLVFAMGDGAGSHSYEQLVSTVDQRVALTAEADEKTAWLGEQVARLNAMLGA